MAPRKLKQAVVSFADSDNGNESTAQSSIPQAVLLSQTTPQQTADYLVLCANTQSGITDTLGVLEFHKQDPDTSADELRFINAEYGDQVAKKARVSAMHDAFIANIRAMRPPSQEVMTAAKNLLKILDDMTASNTTAQAAITTATQLFKTWRTTEAP